VSAAIDLQNASEAAQKNEASGSADQEVKAKLEKDMALKGIHAMWRLNKLDIEATIRGVCELAMKDPGVDKIIRTKRAEGLRMLGRVFTNTKGQPTTLENFM
jgi:hypothetical protein